MALNNGRRVQFPLSVKLSPFRIGVVAIAAFAGSFLAVYLIELGVAKSLNESCRQKPYDVPLEKCGCLSTAMAEQLVTLDYLYRRLYKDEGLSREELDRIRRRCGLSN